MTIDVVVFLQDMRNGFFDFFFSFISFLGEEYVYILVFGIIYYTYDKKMGEKITNSWDWLNNSKLSPLQLSFRLETYVFCLLRPHCLHRRRQAHRPSQPPIAPCQSW